MSSHSQALEPSMAQKREALARLLKNRVEAPRRYPVSFAQQRLWFLDQLEPGSDFYNIPTNIRLNGPLNVAALKRTLNEIMRRHEALRTTFLAVDGQPVQVVAPPSEVPLPLIDLSDRPESEREAEARRLATEDATRPFDLSAGPLLRVTLLRLAEQDHVILVSMHHIVSDGWSMAILVNEVKTLYGAYSEGRESPLPELPIQYADFAVWQRDWLQGEVLEKQMDYWRAQLGGDLDPLQLPTDKTRPAVQSYRGALKSLNFGMEIAGPLMEISQRAGATLFMTLLAAFQALLSRYSGKTQIAVGTPIANRNRAETEGLIGYFINTLVLRTDLSGDPAFAELVERVKEVTLGAYSHQDVPFEKLVEELQPERNMSRAPLVQVMFVLQNAPRERLELPALNSTRLKTDDEVTKYDLTMTVVEQADGLSIHLDYMTDLFVEETIKRMLRQYERVLAAVAAEPTLRVSQLPLLSETEREEVLVRWNDTAVEYPQQCVHELFAAQALRRPEAVALVSGAQQMSYGELNKRSDRLACYLQSLGVGPESRVGICVERSMGMIVGLLGILKAGGAYVPLDARYPLERLSFMMGDAGVSVLLTETAMDDHLPGHWGQTVYLDQENEWSGAGERPQHAAVSADNLVYITYTSGSTGTPKGVEVLHRGVTRLLFGGSYVELSEREVLLQLAPLSFDASTFEIWGALLHGGCLVLGPERAPEARELGELLARHEVGTLWLTASLFNSIVDEAVEVLGGVKQLLVGGEALSVSHIRRALDALPETQLINGYGPTESTTFTCCYRIEGVGAETERISIGRPIGNTRVYILDRKLEPVPVGVAGELYIGGAGLARGYLNGAEVTAERFVPSPIVETGLAGERLYRTGDVARYLSDGRIEYLGRLDDQVKVRGYRIELGEIETVLRRHGGVAEAAVLMREDEVGEKRLVAYVVSVEGEWKGGELKGSELREHLQRTLPEYMVPSAFVMLEKLPLTANGKLDRKSLPAPSELHADDSDLSAPRTPIEELLVTVWQEVLRIKFISREDNFFELGGHSLLATQVISRVREVFHVELPLRSIFEQPSLAEFAESVEAAMKSGQAKPAPIEPSESRDNVPLSFAQQRLWFLDQLEPGSHFYNMPFAVTLSGEVDVETLQRTVTEVQRRHEVLRTRFVETESGPVQVISPVTPIPLPVIDLSSLPPEERLLKARRLALEEAELPFDLSSGPLLRVTLLKLEDTEQIFLLTMHHIICDGWSMGVLVRELAAIYEAYSQGQESPLAELPIQYADFARWQRDWLQHEVLEQQMNYWRQQLGGEQLTLQLPTDRPRPRIQTYAGASRSVVLSKELMDQLKTLSQSEGVTLFMALLAAFQALLARYSGQLSVSIGTPVANRNRAETEDLIGFFVNTLVLRTDLTGDPTFREILNRVREVTLGAYGHQDVPFEKLVEELHPERDMSRSPLFQVMFVLQNAPKQQVQMSKTRLTRVESHGDAAKFDLLLAMSEAVDALTGALQYNTDLFEQATIERMVGHFETLLTGVVANPLLRLSQFPLLTPPEIDQVLIEWNKPVTGYSSHKCVHELFEEQAQRTPRAVAVTYERQQLTYEELSFKSTRLAQRLVQLGVGPESRVGLSVERSLEMIVGIMGIMKAGAAYVPLDPEYPAERLSFILANAGVRLLLTHEATRDRLPDYDGKVIAIDEEVEVSDIALPSVSADSLAYIIHTSGSTGTPKGVMVTHANVTWLLAATQDHYRFNEQDVWTLFHSYAFDLSVWELCGALSYGGRLVIVPYWVSRTPEALLNLLHDERVTVLNQTPSAFRPLLHRDAPELNLRLVIFGGEMLEVQNLRPWMVQPRNERLQFVNMYGITETTVHVTYRPIAQRDLDLPALGSPVGRPLPAARIYLLDPRGNPVPVGVLGEICVGGEGLARGYVNRPDLTAERFIPDSFSGRAGERLYRSGDMARYLPNGELECLGRIDEQVKIRGFRIELGEIEAVLAQHEAVKEAVLVAREFAPGEKQLIAYVVSLNDSIGRVELRSYIKDKLPDYMVPAHFVFLESMPLTTNGKVNRRALPDPDGSRPDLDSLFVAPRTSGEEKLAEIWQEVLNVERVGIHDSFFELGGHSLLATQLISRVREVFKIDMPLRKLFEAPTVSSLLQVIESFESNNVATEQAPEIVPVSRAAYRAGKYRTKTNVEGVN